AASVCPARKPSTSKASATATREPSWSPPPGPMEQGFSSRHGCVSIRPRSVITSSTAGSCTTCCGSWRHARRRHDEQQDRGARARVLPMMFGRRQNGSNHGPAATGNRGLLAEGRSWMKALLGAVAALVVLLIRRGVYRSGGPDIFWGHEKPDDARTVGPYATVDTLVRVAQTMLDKR